MTIGDELKTVLFTIGALVNNDTNVSLLDSAIRREVNLPERQLDNYLIELNSLGLIKILTKPSGVDFRLLNLTYNGLRELENYSNTSRK